MLKRKQQSFKKKKLKVIILSMHFFSLWLYLFAWIEILAKSLKNRSLLINFRLKYKFFSYKAIFQNVFWQFDVKLSFLEYFHVIWRKIYKSRASLMKKTLDFSLYGYLCYRPVKLIRLFKNQVRLAGQNSMSVASFAFKKNYLVVRYYWREDWNELLFSFFHLKLSQTK